MARYRRLPLRFQLYGDQDPARFITNTSSVH